MKIREIRLERFRQFRDTRIEVGDFNLLVGPNNCGKTSILHAVRAFFALMNGHVRFEGTPPPTPHFYSCVGLRVPLVSRRCIAQNSGKIKTIASLCRAHTHAHTHAYALPLSG